MTTMTALGDHTEESASIRLRLLPLRTLPAFHCPSRYSILSKVFAPLREQSEASRSSDP